ncbi:hypothetical protein KDA23_07175 [Candidatus Saccharibacteria bacterium]|nr:hypothetical protein [Candidatus Saccharibacteria bacterium]
MFGVTKTRFEQLSTLDLVLLLGATLLIPTRLAVVSFLVLLWLASRQLACRSYGRLHQFIWGYVYFAVVLASLFMISWLVGVRISTNGVLLLLATATWWLTVFHSLPPREDKKRRAEAVSMLTVGLLTCLFVALPVLRHPSAATVVRYAAHTGDDINHIAMIESTRQTGGYLYTNDRQKHANLIEFRYVNYPQGWHVNGAFLENLLVRLVGSDSLTVRVVSYYGYALLWLFLAVYLLFELAVTTFRLFTKRTSTKDVMVMAGVIGLLAITLLVPLFGYGFQTFIATIVFLLGSSVLAVEYLGAKTDSRGSSYLVGLALMCVGATFTWVLSGVTIGLIVADVLVRTMIVQKDFLKRLPWTVWLGWSLVAMLALMQLFVQLRLSSKGAGSIDSLGAVPPLSTLMTLILVVVTMLAVVRQATHARWLAWIMAAVSLEWAVLALHQQLVFGTQHYYVVKLGYSVALIASVFLLAIGVAATSAVRQKTWMVVLMLAFLALPYLLGVDIKKSAYPLKNSAPIRPVIAQQLLMTSPENQQLIILTSKPEESYLATKFWSSVWTNNSPQRQALLRKLDATLH